MKTCYAILVASCIFVFTSVNSPAQALYPFPSPGLVQTEVYHWDWTQMFVPGNFSFVHQGDTVIGSDTMAKFSWFPVGSSTPWYTWYDNGKVYWIGHVAVPNPANGTLIYDFSLGVGDTFFCSLGFVIYGTYTVTSVSTITLANSQVRKYMELTQGTDTLKWIDGIGDIEHGFLYSSDGEGGYEEFICARDSAGPLYGAPASSFYCDENDPVPTSGPNSCAPFLYNAQVYGTSCLGCDGVITISNITGGAGGYTFQWSTGATTQNAYNLCQGPVTVTIYDANGDSCSRTFVVHEGQIALTVTHDSTYCDGADSVCVIPYGGSAPYTWQWSPAGSTTMCWPLTGNGTYTVIVTDANGCTSVVSIPVTNAQPVYAYPSTITSPSCSNCCDGNVALNISGGTPPYAVTGFPVWPTTNNFCGGWYQYCVTDSLDCAYCDSVYVASPLTVIENNAPDFSLHPNPSDGFVQILVKRPGETVFITDVNGNVVRESQLTVESTRINISELSEGCYFVRIGDSVERLVVIHQ